MKFRKKPVVIEAVQFIFQPERCKELADFLPDGIAPKETKSRGMILVIPTLEGEMVANEGDWIIRGVAGEFYPCKDSIFRATYDSVTEKEAPGNFQAIGKWIHIRPDEKLKRSKEGSIIIPDRAQVVPTTGTIISLGAGPIGDDGERGKFQVKVGDRVMFSAYGGAHVRIKNEDLRCVTEEDIYAVLYEEK